MTIEERYPLTWRYQPRTDEESGIPLEGVAEYVIRMRSGLLPNWPEELLREWLYKHFGDMEDYAFLGFEQFSFERELWDLSRLPGREAFRNERLCDGFQDILEERAEQNDWLARFMMAEGTWNTPIVLLENRGGGPQRSESTRISIPLAAYV